MHEVGELHILEKLLENNADLARHNAEHFDEVGLMAVNFMSAPGAGKTTLLGAVLQQFACNSACRIIEGDMIGSVDADRLRKLGVEVSQISTGRSCHLDAQMVARVVHDIDFAGTDFLFIENVGNLVCPAEFPLGEHKRVVLLSVTEGDDKPLKYPVIFRNCDAVVFTKCDLLPHVDFSLDSARKGIEALNSDTAFFCVSAKTGAGVAEFAQWIRTMHTQIKSQLHQQPSAC